MDMHAEYTERDAHHWLTVPGFSDWYDNYIVEAPMQISPNDGPKEVILADS